jgi:micrococcal nuclease
MYEYRARLVKVVDGDTVDVDIDLGFGIWMKDERVRIMGIDTPESRTRDKVEKLFGKAASARVKELLDEDIILKTQIARDGEDMKGKYGRILGDFIVDRRGANPAGQQELLTDVLVAEGHAVAYFGGSKEEITMKHLANREKLLREEVISRSSYDAAVALMEDKK